MALLRAATFTVAPTALPFCVESFVLAREGFVELACAGVLHRGFSFARGMWPCQLRALHPQSEKQQQLKGEIVKVN